MKLALNTLKALKIGSVYDLPVQEHWKTRGHQLQIDVRKHRHPNTQLRIECEVSTDGGVTWAPGGECVIDGGMPQTFKGEPYTHVKAYFGHESEDKEPCVRRLVRGKVHVIRKFLHSIAPATIPVSVEVVGVEAADSVPTPMSVTPWIDVAALSNGAVEGLIQSYRISNATEAASYAFRLNTGQAEAVGIATFKGSGVITYIQTKSASSSPVASLTTPAMTSVSSHFIGIQGATFVRDYTVVDSNGNTIQTAWAQGAPFGKGQYIENNAGGAGHTFTITPIGGTDYCALAVSEFTGMPMSFTLDKVASAISSTEPHSSGMTATTAQANELFLGGGSTSHGGNTPVTAFNRYFINGGVDNKFSSDTNWSSVSGGANDVSHPTGGDTVLLDASSPSCVIDVPAVCSSFTCTGYTATLTMTASLSVGGNVTLASGMTLSGTADLILTAASTVTNAGKTWLGGVQLASPSNGTQYSLGTWTINGALTCSNPGTSGAFLSPSSLLTVGGGLVMHGHLGHAFTAPTITMTGGTWSAPSTVAANARVGVILNFAGNVTISGTVFIIDNSTVLTYVSGTLTTTGSTISCNGGTLNFGTTHVNNVTLTGVGIVLLSHLILDGTLGWGNPSTFTFTGAFNITCATLSCPFNTVTLSGNITASGALNLGSFGQTVTFNGGFTVTGASCVITSIAHLIVNTPIVITGVTTATWNWSLDGSSPLTTAGLDLSAASPGTGANVGHAVTGGGTIVLTGGILKTNAVDSIEVDLQIAGNVTLVGTILYAVKTLSRVSGTVTAGTSILSILSGTLNTPGMSWANVTLRGTTVTLAAPLVATGTLLMPNGDFTFVGAFNITVGTLTNVSITATRNVTFVSGTTLTINTAFTSVHTALTTVRFNWHTSIPGTTMQFILVGGATQSVKYVDPTDLDASAGQTINTLDGVVHNSINWNGVFTTIFLPSTLVLNPPVVFRVLLRAIVTWVGDVGGTVWVE